MNIYKIIFKYFLTFSCQYKFTSINKYRLKYMVIEFYLVLHHHMAAIRKKYPI